MKMMDNKISDINSFMLLAPDICVTKSFLPPWNEYKDYVLKIYNKGVLTNQGPLVKELEYKLIEFLNVKHLHYLANGTLALQLALAALDIFEGEIITTPFSYVATVSAIIWQRCTPVFVDIEPDNWTLDSQKIEAAITEKTRAIMPVHVFGYSCNVDAIQRIAEKYHLKIIYDAAHAFGSIYHEKALVRYGDISTLSFHATKLFHTIEGGACITADAGISRKLELQKRFGHNYDEHIMPGINAKASEFHAAMGLCNMPYINYIFKTRRHISERYDEQLAGMVKRPKPQNGLRYNYAYYPVLFDTKAHLQNTFEVLSYEHIYPRRYFNPSLNTLPYLKGAACPVAEDISQRIACLPLYTGLTDHDIDRICGIINKVKNTSLKADIQHLKGTQTPGDAVQEITASKAYPAVKLHLGCGTAYKEGWINIDNNGNKNINRIDLMLDLHKALPFADNSVDFIYHEHFFEHINIEEIGRLLRDFFRVLKPGGVMRAAMPNLVDIVQWYLDNDWKEHQKIFIHKFGLDFVQTKAELININFRSWGHQWIYDYEELERRLRDSGCFNIKQCEINVSEYAELCNLETRKESTLIVEVIK